MKYIYIYTWITKLLLSVTQFDSGNFLEHSTKTASQMIQTGIPMIRALQVVALVASPVLRSALSHDTLHCPAASSWTWIERTSLGTLFWGLGVAFQQKDIVFVHSTRFFPYSSQHIETTSGRKTQSIKANGSLQEPFSQSSLRVNDDRLLFLAIAIGHIRHAVHLSKTCCGSTLTQISASRWPEWTLLKECCLIASCTFKICLFDCFWTWLNPGSSQYNIT